MPDSDLLAPPESRPTSDPRARTVAELAAHVGGKVVGDPTIVIRGLARLELAADHEIAFVEDQRWFAAAAASRASCVIVPEAAPVAAPCRIEARKPKLAFVQIAELLLPRSSGAPSIHPTAIIEEGAAIHPSVSIGPHASIGAHTRIGPETRIAAGVVIGRHVAIGSGCALYPNVVLYDRVQIGDRVILHAGACIGADGFGYVRDLEAYRKFPQLGTVTIEDDVELGAGACVDRGALGPTRVGRGSKLDNLVHVGHNVDIGERVVIAAQTGISGSVVIEDDVVLAGQVGIADHVRVQRGAVIGAKAGVPSGKIIRRGSWWGIPAQPLANFKRLHALWRRLPQLRAELGELRQRLNQVQASIAPSDTGESK